MAVQLLPFDLMGIFLLEAPQALEHHLVFLSSAATAAAYKQAGLQILTAS